MMTSRMGSRLPKMLMASGAIRPRTVSHSLIAGSSAWKKFSEMESITTQKMVFRPNFQPMTNPAASSRMPFTANAIVPTGISKPVRLRISAQSTSERPVAPPPVPFAGMTQAIHANV